MVAGEAAAVDQVADAVKALGRKVSRLKVSHAFHSPLMEPMLEDFRSVLESVVFGVPSLAVVSNVTGRAATAAELGSVDYWVGHVRQPVRFADGLSWLASQRATRFLEIGPDGTLTAMAQGTLDPDEVLTVPVLRKDRPEPEAVLTALARVHIDGARVDWTALLPGAQRVELPTYAFRRDRYWLDPSAAAPKPSDDSRFASTLVDTRFWEAVEREDLDALAEVLGADHDALGAVIPALSSWRRAQNNQRTVDSWRYRVSWKPLTVASDAPTATGRWVVAVPGAPAEDDAVQAVLNGLGSHGLDVLPLEVDGHDRSRLAAELGSAVEGGPVDGVVSLLALADAATAMSTADLVNAMGDAGVTGRLWALTRGAVSTGRSDALAVPDQAAVWGLGRVAALEHPHRWGGLIDLPGSVDDRAVSRLARVLAGLPGAEDQLAIRASGVFGRRLLRAQNGDDSQTWSPRGAVLVTGGTGALGARVARWAVERGAPEVVLVSRSGEQAPGAAELAAELGELGARVTIAACDVSDRDALADLLQRHPVDSVFHAAGVLDDGVLDSIEPARYAAVLAAKAGAARNLHELTRDADLSAFVLFASLAGVMGSAGQGAYAAANAVLDALAEQRHALGLPATSIAWGPWSGGGMAAEAAVERRQRRGAVAGLDPELALSVLGTTMESGDPAVMVADIDWSWFGPSFTATRPSAFVSEIPEMPSVAAESNAAGMETNALRQRLSALSAEEQSGELLGLVRSCAAAALGFAGVGEVAADRAFRDLGVDSLIAVELRNVLGAECGLSLPSTVVFDYPTPSALASFLRDELAGVVAEVGTGSGGFGVRRG